MAGQQQCDCDFFEVPISRAGGFFYDPVFDDNRNHYHDAIRNTLHNWSKKSAFSNTEEDDFDKYFSEMRQNRQKNKQERRQRFQEFFDGWGDDWVTFSDSKHGISNRFPGFKGNNQSWSAQQNFENCKNFDTTATGADGENVNKCFNKSQQSYQCQMTSGFTDGSGQCHSTSSQQSFQTSSQSQSDDANDGKENICKIIKSEDSASQPTNQFKDASHKLIEENFDSYYDNKGNLQTNPYFDTRAGNDKTSQFRNISKDCQTQTSDFADDFLMKERESFVPDHLKDDMNMYEVPKKKTSKVTWGEDDVDEFLDDYSDYRHLRQKLPSDDTYASIKREEDLNHKIVLDVRDYRDGEVKIRVKSPTEILVECWAERLEGQRMVKLNFSKPYKFDDPIDVTGVTSLISSDGVLTITVPKLIGRESTPLRSCLKNKDIF